MDSDSDMFADSQSQSRVQSQSQSRFQSQSQSQSLVAPVMRSPESQILDTPIRSETASSFGYLVLFAWSPQVKKPFNIYLTHDFSAVEIRDAWIECSLSDKWRCRKLKPTARYPFKDFSLFGKIETGLFIKLYIYILI